MKKIILLLCSLSCLFISVYCNSKKKITLIDQGKAVCQIVLPEQPTATEKKAAMVFQDYFKRITGVALPVVAEDDFNKNEEAGIFIGLHKKKSDYTAEIINDGFVIQTDERNLYLYGLSGKGTLYSVYTFLDKYLHCKKLVGNEPAITPRTNHITIPAGLQDIQNPAFIFRQSFYPSSNDPEYLDWHKLQRFEDLWGLWGHSFFKIISPEKYFDEHPEYFSLVNGKRQASQLCLSNPDVFRLTVNYLKTAMQKNPDALYWSISQMDNLHFCTCTQCRAADSEEGGPQGSLIRFVNKVAQQFPDKVFVTLAYTYSAQPPLKTRPAKNVYIMLSSIDANRTENLEEEPTARSFRKNLVAWSEITDRIFVWDYTTQFTNYLCPFPAYGHVFSDADFMLKHGVKGIFFQGSGDDPSDMAALNSYLQAAALWNPGQDPNAIEHEFIKAYFGKAAGPVTEYLNALKTALKTTHTSLSIYGNPVNDRKGYLSPSLIDRYSAYLDTAEALTEDNPLLYRHVEQIRIGLEYVVLQQALAYGIHKYGYFNHDDQEDQYVISPKWISRINRFYESAQRLNIKTLGETGPSLDAYYEHWQKVFATGWKKNPASDAHLTLSHPFSEDYPANGLNTLVDGIEGSLDYSYNWLLFYGKDLLLTLQFKQPKKVSGFSIDCLSDPQHSIFLPEQIQILASEDGIQYKPLVTKILNPAEAHGGPAKIKINIPIPCQAKYFKVHAVCPKQISGAEIPPGKKPTIAFDEVLIK